MRRLAAPLARRLAHYTLLGPRAAYRMSDDDDDFDFSTSATPPSVPKLGDDDDDDEFRSAALPDPTRALLR